MLPLLVRIDNLTTGESRQLAFARSPVRIGRNPLNDLVLDAPYISQWHAVVRFDEGATEFIDLGSTNGTVANGYRLEKNQPIPVAGNVELRVNELRIFCWRGAADAAALGEAPAHSIGPRTRTLLEAERRSNRMPIADHAPHISGVVAQMAPYYVAYRQAWLALMGALRQVLAGLPRDQQQQAILALQREMPAVATEDDFRAMAGERQVAVGGAAGLEAGALQILAEFARALVPGLALGSLDDVERLLVRAATTLETSARAFVELRKGYAEFGDEMAVRTVNEMTPLHQAQQPAEVLAYLLDIRADASARIQELTSVYADIMIHQVALLGGMMEGVRSLLARLGPEAIEREIERDGVRVGPLRLPRALWPFRARARWRRFVARHVELAGEERQLSAAVFGAEFARAYSAVAVAGDDAHDRSGRMRVAGPPS